MSTSPSTERYRLLPLQIQIFGLVLCWTLTIIAVSIPHWIPRVASVFTGCLAIAFLFFPETRIDFERGVITDTGRFLGVLRVWQHQWTKDEFIGIRCYCSSRGSYDSPDTWVVALYPRHGRAIGIRQFSVAAGSEDCPEARAFAHEFSGLTGLEVIEDDV